MDSTSLDRARAVKERAKAVFAFASKAAVVGVGIAKIDGVYGVKIHLGEPPPPDADLPETLDGVPIRVAVVGTIRKR